MSDATIEVFINEDESESVALIMVDPGIVEYREELAPACSLTAWQARCLAASLVELADELEGRE